MDEALTLPLEIKQLIVDNLMLQMPPEEIAVDQRLFGPESLGLDSVDALQLVVALDKRYGLKINDAEAAQRILQSVQTMTEAVEQHLARVGDSA